MVFVYGAVGGSINSPEMNAATLKLLSLALIGTVIWMWMVGFRDTAIRIPLLIITIFYVICISGALWLGFHESVYAFFGLAMLGSMGWMWIIELRR